MTSSHTDVRYAGITLALFDHFEQDLLHLTTALLDDDEDEMMAAGSGAVPGEASPGEASPGEVTPDAAAPQAEAAAPPQL